MFKSKSILVVSSITLMLFFLVGSFSGVVADNPEMVIRIGHMEPAGSFTYEDVELLADIVGYRTGGRIEIENHPGGTLGTAGSQVDGLIAGTHDMTLQTSAVINLVEEEQYWDLPYLFEDRMAVTRFVNSDIRETLEQNYENAGLKLLGYFDMGFRQSYYSGVGEVRVPEDMQGVMYRSAPGSSKFAVWDALGITATPVSFSELYEALDTGMVEGGDNALAAVYGSAFHEVADYITLHGMLYNPMILVAGQNFWATIPEEDQKIIEEAARVVATASRHRGEAADLRYTSYFEESDQIEVVHLTDEERNAWVEATRPVYEAQREAIGDDLMDFILDFLN